MAAHVGDTNKLERLKGRSKTTPPVPYASRGAGLYSEVGWDPIAALHTHPVQDADKGDGSGHRARPGGPISA